MYNLEYITQHKHVLDSKKLLDLITNELNKYEDRATAFVDASEKLQNILFEKARLQTKKMSSFHKKALLSKKNADREVDRLILKSNATNDLNQKKEIRDRVSEIINDLESNADDLSSSIRSAKDLIKTFRPISDNADKIKSSFIKMTFKIYFYKTVKFLFSVAFVIFIAFFINLYTDKFQSITESLLIVNHLNILILSFALQTFVIEPYLLNILKDRINWKLIKILILQIDSMKERFKFEVNQFNEQIKENEELEKFHFSF